MVKFENFLKNTVVTQIDKEIYTNYKPHAKNAITNSSELSPFFEKMEGCTFEKGLFRTHNIGSSLYWTKIASIFFPSYKEKFWCFGFDWMGRMYAVDISNYKIIYMFDPATGEVFDLEQSLEGFFNEDLVDFKDETLNREEFTLARNLYGESLKFTKCIGFKIPLFLGGNDDGQNLELVDMDSYWELNYQLYCQINNFKGGELIKNISID